MSRILAWMLVLAGVLAIGRWTLHFLDVQYYDPENLTDYSAVIVQSGAGLATGIALILLWRDPPVRRGSALILVGGIAAIAQGLGNLFEDAFGLAWGEWGFFVGGVGMVFGLAGAGALALSVKSPLRWSGAFLLLGATGGMLGLGLVIMGLAWFGFAAWILHRIGQPETAAVA